MSSIKFISILSAAATLVLAPCVMASTLFTYATDDITWQSEVSIEDGYSTPFDSYFYESEGARFEVSFITPDFERATGQQQHLTFYDPVISIKASTFNQPDVFNSYAIEQGSYITFDLSPDHSLELFSFSFSFNDFATTTNDSTHRGTLTSIGNLNPLEADASNADEFRLQHHNLHYSRHDQTWTFDTSAYFFGANLNQAVIQKISVSEPFVPALMLIGFAFIVSIRRLRYLE